MQVVVGLAHGGPDELNKWLQRILSWGMGSETLPLVHVLRAAKKKKGIRWQSRELDGIELN